jgi:hypothetical protein
VSLHHRVQLNHCWIRHTLQLRDNAQHFFLLVVRTGWLQGRSRAVWVVSTVTLRLPPRKKLSFCAGVKLSSNRGRFVNFAGGIDSACHALAPVPECFFGKHIYRSSNPKRHTTRCS